MKLLACKGPLVGMGEAGKKNDHGLDEDREWCIKLRGIKMKY